MRTLNVKRTVILLVAVIVVAGSAHLLHSFQLQRNSSSFKTQAEAAWNDKRDHGRPALMWAYLLLKPQDFEAREEFGSWFLASGRFGKAYRDVWKNWCGRSRSRPRRTWRRFKGCGGK